MVSAIRFGALAALVCAAAAAACGGSQEAVVDAPAAVVENPVDPATAATISGSVMLVGMPPAPQPINRRSDPYCDKLGLATTEDILAGNNGTLRNVFVYVKDGLGQLKFPVPATPVVFDQMGCAYVPHVFGIQAGQPLEIVNSDPTLHNIHAMPENNQEFNRGQAQQGDKHTHVFSTREVMVPFKCDVHNWMRAHVGVLDHPFYAVSGADGSFSLAGLPPGTYTVEAWHEKLGTQTQSVTVGAKESKIISFTFKL
jgi:plastocyanin